MSFRCEWVVVGRGGREGEGEGVEERREREGGMVLFGHVGLLVVSMFLHSDGLT